MLISRLPGKALGMFVESRGLPSDLTCYLEAEPGKLEIKRREPVQVGTLFKLSIMALLSFFVSIRRLSKCGRVAQSVTCLSTDTCLTADPGVASSIPVRSHTFVEIDHEIISTVILLPSADLFKKGCCQLQAKVCARITG